jgi:hypothetical protein
MRLQAQAWGRLRISDVTGEPNTFRAGYRETAMTDKTSGDDAHDSSEYPEVFSDASLPQLYKLRIVNLLLPEAPVLRIEVDGQALINSLRESMFRVMRNVPDSEEIMREAYGAIDWDDLRADMTADKDYLESEQGMFWFFVRHFPKLMVNIYNITALMSVISAIGRLLDDPAEKELKEKAVRETLKLMLRLLGNDIKQMLETRPSGRPKKYGTGRLPEIVRRVLLTAWGMMGESRGKDAVPVLKGVALNLYLSENALRKQLVRAGHPWAGIRDWLAKQP